MCVHFQSWNRCSSCFLTFNRRRNRVPCWNGSLSRWRIHRHGLSCRSGWYERADDEVYTHLFCEACAMEAAILDREDSDDDADNTNHHHVDNDDDDDDGKGHMVEESRGRRRRSTMRSEDEATALTTDIVTTREVAKKSQPRSFSGVLVRLFSLGEVLRVRKTSKGRRHFHVSILML
ncbi:hypothetical protein M419DRAFT_37445 [Trichoderma reesei RUT C-30]|uniref:Uncharacterized protein n=1 Tax=Hypocrea jecorina (strain ATCC 56765 / BCRC 32924 / NRRL 11460 / Rut C-30) TaxID=1344414 RepID=A0A024S5K2_HYPJR|nr:hypothetical protein M419DRAFT_37445 [Trichoderma reesei RUT C-30]